MKSKKLLGKLFVGTAVLLGTAGMGCLARPVSKGAPTTKVNFTNTVSQQAVDKVDILFAIDNSQSMGDKQDILKEAVPDLIQGLLRPNCVERESRAKTGKHADPNLGKDDNYGCDKATSEPEFKPVTDLHIGIVSSSLGNLGGNVCATTNPRTNDNALLLNYKDPVKTDSHDTTNAPDGFLAWYPSSPENDDKKRHPEPSAPIRVDSETEGLTPDFTALITGVGQNGCGLEAQLESVYRFLIQPDPWTSVGKDASGLADLGSPDDVDTDILKQRADFLRPDSLVAVIMLTDEDDSSADPLSVGGFGFAFMSDTFPNSKVKRGDNLGMTAPRGTSDCATDPGSDNCTSCGFAGNCDPNTALCQHIRQDPNCDNADGGFYGPDDDDLNVRFHRMKERYGVDPQYPISRYVNGFQSLRVPDRSGEHTITTNAAGKRIISNYVGTPNCTNPLFAAQLPHGEQGDELCNLPKGTRTADLVFFAVIGGVPPELLHFDPSGTEEAADKNRITEDDWKKIIGQDPVHYNYDGIDPHMIQSVEPRKALVTANNSPDLPRGNNGTDPYNGREWETKKRDLQYACTFPLNVPRPCGANALSCDCLNDPNDASKPLGNQPLCAEDGSPTQTRAKAYPTIREFEVVHELKDQGIISSLCPITIKPEDKTNENAPKYGYRPAVATIIERLKNALTTQCLPQKLRSDEEEAADTPLEVPCLVLAQLSPDTQQGQSCQALGMEDPEKAVLDVFLQQQKADTGNVVDGGLDLASLQVCKLKQKVVKKGDTCANDSDLEWCYVSNNTAEKKTPAGRCPQALLFSTGTSILAGARFSLQCIQQFSEGQAAQGK